MNFVPDSLTGPIGRPIADIATSFESENGEMYEKKFTLTMDVKEFPDGDYRQSVPVTHFGMSWYLRLRRKEEHLGVYLGTGRKKSEEKPWSVGVTYEFRLTSATGEIKRSHKLKLPYTFCDDMGYGTPKFVSWKEAIEDGNSKVVCHVTIGKTTGFATKRHRSFDEPKENLTDVILKVEDKKFHVSKAVLATHSSYFERMFFGKFDEAKQEEIELKDTHTDAFQALLEILHGEFKVADHNVADLLILADKFDVQLVRNRCEKFLKKSKQVDKKEELILADAFKLENLMKHCLESVMNAEELDTYLPDDLAVFSPPTMILIVKKFCSLSHS